MSRIDCKQARKGFRPISASQNFLGIFWERFGNFLGFSGNYFEIFWEFFWNFLGILRIFFWDVLIWDFLGNF